MWLIYYDDGTVFSSADGAFEDAPTDGVLYVLQKRGDIIVTLSGSDWYAMIDGEIVAPDEIGPLLRKVGWIKMGRYTSFKRFREVGQQAAADAGAMNDGN